MKQIYCLLLGLTFFLIQEIKAQPFVTKWDLSIPGSGATQLSFGVGTTGLVNYTWETIPAGMNGSGTFTGSTATITGLPAGAMIRLSIDTANFNRILMYSSADTNRLLDVTQWGAVQWSTMDSSFSFCHNLNITSTDIPDLSMVSSMMFMFMNCTSLNGPVNINAWNTSNVNLMYSLFQGAASFNQPINDWDVSHVWIMNSMFFNASSFNQPIGIWNTTLCWDFIDMFRNATSFNQRLDSLEIDNINLFQGGLFDMLTNSGMDCQNYSTTLYGWSTYPNTPNDLILGAGNMQYGINAQSARNNLIQVKNWGFYGDTLSSTSCCFTSYDSINIISCNQYFFNNQMLTSSGTYYDTLLSIYGCDSVLKLNLIINQTTLSSINSSVCNSFNFNNQLLTSSGLYYDILLNANGCDSLVQLNLIIIPPSFTSLSQTACNSYFFNNQNLTSSGVYYDTLLNASGCDSIIQLNLTISPSSTNSISQTACNSYFFNNQNLTSSGVYYDTLLNASGCDSIIQLNLTISSSTTNPINQTACNSFLFNNQNLTSSGVYYDTLLNVSGCDSIIVLNLTINQANASITQAGANLSATTSGAAYQWISCNPYQIISGATNQNYTATTNGDYAVIVTENGCTDTSACATVMGIGLNENNNDKRISIYPNPTKGKLYLNIGRVNVEPQTHFEIYNTLGQLLLTKDINPHTQTELDISHLAKGMYYLHVGHVVAKVIVE